MDVARVEMPDGRTFVIDSLEPHYDKAGGPIVGGKIVLRENGDAAPGAKARINWPGKFGASVILSHGLAKKGVAVAFKVLRD